jgi:uncharacterized protein involved in exopolysaccharide biosynthesis
VNPRYRETFGRHRVLFVLPVVLAGALALWAAAAAPKMYRSGATLWSDSAAASSGSIFGALPPAGQDQQLLNELLTTRYFQTTIANRSPLAAYIRAHPPKGWGPTALLGKLRGTPTFDEQLAQALSSKRVLSNAKGPHVLEISYDAPDPALAKQTLQAIIAEFRKQRGALRQDALAAAQKQVSSASATLARARQNLTRYVDSHPSSDRADPELQSLATAEREAVMDLQTTSQTMNEATLAVANGASGQTVLRLVDAPQLPPGPSTGKKKIAETVIAGLFAGLLISILGIIALARTGARSADAELDDPVSAPAAEGAAVSRLGGRRERVAQEPSD